MMTRFLPISVVLSSALFGAACSRASDAVPMTDSQAEAACEPPPGIPEVVHQWDALISGNSALPSHISELLQNASREESLAMNPCHSIRERTISSVSSERHYRIAYGLYQEVLSSMDDGISTGLRRRIRDKMAVMAMSIQTLNDMNCRYLTAGSCNPTFSTE